MKPKSKSKRAATETLGARIQRLRKDLGLSREELAEKAGVLASSVRNWEQDYREPYVRPAVGLARALGTTVKALVDGGDVNNGKHHAHDANGAAPPQETLGRRIQRLRLGLGLTQKELAEKADILFNSVKNWEGDFREPTVRLAVKFADALETTVEDLVSGTTPIGGDVERAHRPAGATIIRTGRQRKVARPKGKNGPKKAAG